jgi:hypothetical protein
MPASKRPIAAQVGSLSVCHTPGAFDATGGTIVSLEAG